MTARRATSIARPSKRTRLAAMLCPLALAASLATTAQAADRYWTFIGGCGSADWISTTAGSNAQGRFNCWSDSFGGLSGQTFPTASDDVFVLAPGATSTLLVNVAAASRPAFTAVARDITLYGNSSFAAGLSIDRHALSLRSLLIGAEGLSFLGRFDQSAGSVTVGNNLALRAGEYNLSGGTLSAGQIFVRSQTAAARYTQTGGSLVTADIDVRSEFGRDASFHVRGGSVASTAVTLGSALGTGSSAATVSGPGASWNQAGTMLVGSVAAATLDINNRAQVFSASAVIGSSLGGDGVATVADLSTRWTVAGLLTVGNVGNGVLNLRDGGRVDAGSVVLNGKVGNNATATLTGARTLLSTGSVVVGRDRSASMDIVSGAAVGGSFGVLGDKTGINGSVRLLGGGARWSSSSGLVVGQEGSGRIEVIGTALLQSQDAAIGLRAGSAGAVLISGSGAHWQATNAAGTQGTLRVGRGGTGSVTLSAGGTLNTLSSVVGDAYVVSFDLIERGTGTVLLEGAGSLWQTVALTVGNSGSGSFSAGSASRLEAFSVVLGFNPVSQGVLAASGSGTRINIADELQIGVAGTAALTVSGGAALTAGATRIGDVANGNGTVRVEGVGSTWASAQPLVVGRYAQGSFTVGPGGTASVGRLAIGQQSNGVRGTGSATATGLDSKLLVAGAINVGDGGFGTLTVDSGGLIESGALTQAGTLGRVVITSGGTLRSASIGLGDPTRLDWRSGTLHITGNGGVALDGQQLPTLLDLQSGRSLKVDRTLLLGSSSTMLLSGGTLQAGTLRLDGGVLASTGGGAFALQMDAIGTLAAQGQVSARINGGSYGNNTVVATGPLTLGLASRADGFAFGGLLDLGSNQVVLLDSDLAGLGAMTVLRDGAQLATVNGVHIDPGSMLRSFGRSSVQGRVVNDGRVQVESSGLLSFLSNVSGNGDFSGNVRFLAGYDPGNSTAQVGFNGGNLSFGQHAVLTLQIDGIAPGSSFDRLAGIGELGFDGTLVLDFGSGFAAAPGTVLSLLDFRNLTGRLDAAHTVVMGYDVAQLDLSRLAIDGTVSVTAVPEPNASVMWMAGLGMLGFAMRRLRKQPH